MNEEIVSIERVVFGGKGLSRDLSKVVFVPFTLPGEKVRIRILREKADYMEAEALEILEPSPDRVVPDCRYFGLCGGCHLSHAKYSVQTGIKEKILQETFTRNGLTVPEFETFTSPPYGYRHRARLRFDAQSKLLGFLSSGSNRVVDIQECLCLTPALNELLNFLRRILFRHSGSQNQEIFCYENETGETAVFMNPRLRGAAAEELSQHTKILPSDSLQAALRYRFRDYQLPMHPDYFQQVNPRMWNTMVQEVEAPYLSASQDRAVEFYSGSGFLTVPLSARFERITAVEENPAAVRFSESSHTRTNIEWICRRAEHFKIPEDVNVAILDPPRQGISAQVCREMIRSSVDRITYVSCDVSTLCRDLKVLCGAYQLIRTSLLDLFPQTYHFETISHLKR